MLGTQSDMAKTNRGQAAAEGATATVAAEATANGYVTGCTAAVCI